MTKLAVALGFLALNFYTYHFLANEAVIPERRSFSEFPLEPGGGWVCPGLDTMAEMYAGVNTFGTPEQIVEQLRSQKEILGCDHDILVIPKYGSMTQQEAIHSVTLFAREVIPNI